MILCAPSILATLPLSRCALRLTFFLFAVATAPVLAAPVVDLDYEEMSGGFSQPVQVVSPRDSSGRLFVVEKGGTIRVVDGDGNLESTPFLDVSASLYVIWIEQGLLGLVFHPDYENNGRFFIHYTSVPDGRIIIAEYTVSGDPNVANPANGRTILPIPHPEANHNAGWMGFHPHDRGGASEGYLYIAMGDGGGAGDAHGPIGNAQDPGALLGSMMRIDVDSTDTVAGMPYSIPPDNPYAQGGGRPEIFAKGLRNPFRCSFDAWTGRLFIGDVGQGAWEEVTLCDLGDNLGWRLKEGFACYNPAADCDPTGATRDPIAVYPNLPGIGASVTGGYVYRGARFPNLQGLYVFADFGGQVYVLEEPAVNPDGAPWPMTAAAPAPFQISSFGEDEDAELLMCGFDTGAIYRLVDLSPPPLAARDSVLYE